MCFYLRCYFSKIKGWYTKNERTRIHTHTPARPNTRTHMHTYTLAPTCTHTRTHALTHPHQTHRQYWSLHPSWLYLLRQRNWGRIFLVSTSHLENPLLPVGCGRSIVSLILQLASFQGFAAEVDSRFSLLYERRQTKCFNRRASVEMVYLNYWYGKNKIIFI